MLQIIFNIFSIIFLIIILQNILQIFNINIIREKFSIGGQEDNTDQEDNSDQEDSDIFDTKNMENNKNIKMDLKDLYTNLCPLDYHINMIKLKDMVTKVNNYPGYTKDILIDNTRQIKSNEPIPMSPDFLK
tara:strand:+ start:577 stop:969 length:393 start_codon:yes stop_codon:yes gene_type:complete